MSNEFLLLNKNTRQALVDIQAYVPPKLQINNDGINRSQNILLTGANGYLGVHLIQQILKRTTASIYCAIRAEDKHLAKAKLFSSFKHYNIMNDIDENRIHIVLVDLAKEQIGIDNETWQYLSNNIDVIYHNGAYVHHLQTYERMAPTNVGSTQELIKLAALNKLKRIHFISTKYSIVNSVENIAHEGAPTIAPPHKDIAFGYTITKWAAEWMLWKAQFEGIPVDIYRIGQISGHSCTGFSNYQKNNITRFIVGCLEMGFAPDLVSQHEMVPVDQVAQVVINLSLLPYVRPSGWNVVNSNQISHAQIFNIMQDLGYDVEIIEQKKWREKLREVDKNNKLYPLIDYYDNDEKMPFITTENKETRRNSDAIIDTDYHGLFRKYIKYWKSEKFSEIL